MNSSKDFTGPSVGQTPGLELLLHSSCKAPNTIAQAQGQSNQGISVERRRFKEYQKVHRDRNALPHLGVMTSDEQVASHQPLPSFVVAHDHREAFKEFLVKLWYGHHFFAKN